MGGFGGLSANPMGALQQAGETAAVEGGGEPVVVSVGLLPVPSGAGKKSHTGELYPLDQFTLDVFVFNQSSWTRRFEVSYPEERRRRRKAKERGDGPKEYRTPGIIPLQNRVRIGCVLCYSLFGAAFS